MKNLVQQKGKQIGSSFEMKVFNEPTIHDVLMIINEQDCSTKWNYLTYCYASWNAQKL